MSTKWNQARRILAPTPLLAGLLLLAGCAAATIADHMPTAAGGLPERAPPRPEMPRSYPAVHDMPPPRATSVLTEEEQKKLEDDLAAARKRAAGAAGKPAGSAGRP
jgi:hypothetical protein